MNGRVHMLNIKGLLYEINYEKTSDTQHLQESFGLSNKREFANQLRD